MTTPVPATKPETKVVVGTSITLLASVIVAVLNAILANNALLGTIPPLAQAFILVIIPPLLTFLAAYAAPHTPRSYPNTGDQL